MNDPLVSVIVTTCNRRELLGRALDSINSQTYNNIEIIVTDDCSTDDTEYFVVNYKLKSRFPIIYRRNKSNKGACYTRNEGIRLASGVFYTGLDDDDSFSKDRVMTFYRKWEDKYSFISSNILVHSRKGSYPLFYGSSILTSKKLLWYNYAGNQVFTRLERIKKAGLFSENLTSCQDIDLWLQLTYKYGDGFRISDCTYNLYVDHDLPRITTSKNKIYGQQIFFEKHLTRMNSSQKKNYELKILFWKNNKKFRLKYFTYLSTQSIALYLWLIYTKGIRFVRENT